MLYNSNKLIFVFVAKTDKTTIERIQLATAQCNSKLRMLSLVIE